MMAQAQDATEEVVVVQFEGRLDAIAAARVRPYLLRASPGARVILDLTRVRDVEHLGLARLAQELARVRGSPNVVLRGMCEHHLRMLRYFGVDAGAFEGGRRSSGDE
jgi:anti-anti-sigma regulatory factor